MMVMGDNDNDDSNNNNNNSNNKIIILIIIIPTLAKRGITHKQKPYSPDDL